jgi:hypothetical protein
MVRTFITALLAICLWSPAVPVSAQTAPPSPNLSSLSTRLHARFEILAIANGIVLTPRFRSTVRAIEVSDASAIALDGAPATGAELIEKLGADAQLVLELSYADPASRRVLLGLTGSSATTAPPVVSEPPVQPEMRPNPSRPRRRDDIVRFGGNVTVTADEVVDGDVAVIGGSASINGQVEGNVAVIGGSLSLGERADVKGDVTVVGGSLSRHPSATIGGKVSEVGMGDAIRMGRDSGVNRPSRVRWGPNSIFGPVVGFVGTLIWLALLTLLTGIVLLVARVPVQQIADRAAAEPVKSWAVGFLAEILFVPVLVITVFVLAVSIIGIPLLLLVPVALVAALLVCLVGFTGMAYHIGRLIEGRFEQIRNSPYLATFIGIAVIVSPLLLAHLIGLVSGFGVVANVLVFVGVVAEYVAWTAGVGAAALVRFGSRPGPPPPQPLPLPPA